MNDKNFRELLESVKHAGEYMRGERKPSRIFRYTPANVRSKPKRLDCVASDKCKINFEQEMK